MCIVILASCEHHFISVHENLWQHPSNYISIDVYKGNRGDYHIISNINPWRKNDAGKKYTFNMPLYSGIKDLQFCFFAYFINEFFLSLKA